MSSTLARNQRLEKLEPLPLGEQSGHAAKAHERWAQPLDLTLDRKLNGGSTAMVFQCKHSDISNQAFAAKIYELKDCSPTQGKEKARESKARNIDIERKALNEANLLTNLRHEHLIEFLGAYRNDKYLVIVVELAKGGDLLERVVGIGAEPYDEFVLDMDTDFPGREDAIAKIIKQVAQFLKYLKGEHVIHRDIKPDNLLFQDSPYEYQFGLKLENHAICVCDLGESVETMDGKAIDEVGTIFYNAPEMLAGKTYDRKVDMWSLGATTYELLCGRKPFTAGHEPRGAFATDEEEIKHHIMSEKPIELQEEPWPKYSANARDFVLRCLDRDPNTRMSAAGALDHAWLKGRNISGDSNRPVTREETITKVKTSHSTHKGSMRRAADKKSRSLKVGSPEGKRKLDTDSHKTTGKKTRK